MTNKEKESQVKHNTNSFMRKKEITEKKKQNFKSNRKTKNKITIST